MKDAIEKQKFIELRAKGLSFDKIVQEIGISKPTLLKWSRDYEKEITNLVYFQFEAIIEQFRLEKNSRVELIAMILSRAMEELKSRSFDELSVKELLAVIEQTSERLKNEVSSIRYVTEEYEDPIGKLEDEILTPKTLPFFY